MAKMMNTVKMVKMVVGEAGEDSKDSEDGEDGENGENAENGENGENSENGGNREYSPNPCSYIYPSSLIVDSTATYSHYNPYYYSLHVLAPSTTHKYFPLYF
jgi:hypothetical protein